MVVLLQFHQEFSVNYWADLFIIAEKLNNPTEVVIWAQQNLHFLNFVGSDNWQCAFRVIFRYGHYCQPVGDLWRQNQQICKNNQQAPMHGDLGQESRYYFRKFRVKQFQGMLWKSRLLNAVILSEKYRWGFKVENFQLRLWSVSLKVWRKMSFVSQSSIKSVVMAKVSVWEPLVVQWSQLPSLSFLGNIAPSRNSLQIWVTF